MSIETILEVAAWPIVVLILGFVLLMMLRKSLQGLVDRVAGFKMGEKLEFSAASPGEIKKAAEQITDRRIEWTKVAHLYWLGHDLMYALNAVTTIEADRQLPELIHGLERSIHHAERLTLSPALLDRLEELLKGAKAAQNANRRVERQIYARELHTIRMIIGSLAAEHQGDYE